ncbi:hypothetical protein DPMN_081244 [Dreissena polymorpha]|uniref:Uncharacterized protein n=1 Tax=Dreissena polymorpha TaxID=45954 RepID=A0A9D3Y7P6_DREPO|nr:hypothetical protein DPMN_081244 [Dreissena polymorpha]
MFKVVAVGSRPEHFSATSMRSLGSLLRPSGVYGVLYGRSKDAVRTPVRCDGGITQTRI